MTRQTIYYVIQNTADSWNDVQATMASGRKLFLQFARFSEISTENSITETKKVMVFMRTQLDLEVKKTPQCCLNRRQRNSVAKITSRCKFKCQSRRNRQQFTKKDLAKRSCLCNGDRGNTV